MSPRHRRRWVRLGGRWKCLGTRVGSFRRRHGGLLRRRFGVRRLGRLRSPRPWLLWLRRGLGGRRGRRVWRETVTNRGRFRIPPIPSIQLGLCKAERLATESGDFSNMLPIPNCLSRTNHDALPRFVTVSISGSAPRSSRRASGREAGECPYAQTVGHTPHNAQPPRALARNA